MGSKVEQVGKSMIGCKHLCSRLILEEAEESKLASRDGSFCPWL